MTLSWFLLSLFLIFLLPSILLPQNRLRLYLFGTLSSCLVILVFFIVSFSMPEGALERNIGGFFLFLFPFIGRNIELTFQEMCHLSFCFILLIFYLFVYLIVFLIFKYTYVGTNPNIHRSIKRIRRVFQGILFFLSAYIPLFFFFLNIRGILYLPDGFLASLFNLFYEIKA